MSVCKIMTLSLLGVALLAAGVVLPQVFPSIMSSKLDSNLILREDSPTIGNFISPPVPIFMQFYFFNVTNPVEILNGSTAELKQIGPFTYEEKRLKYDLQWDDDSSTVTFKQNKTFFFRPDMSNGLAEDTMLTVVNPILITLGAKTSKPNKHEDFIHGVFELVRMRFELQPFINKKAGDLLFHGYEEETLSFLAPLTKNPLHATGRFGFFFPKNNSNDGSYKVNTGANGLENLQLIDEFKGKPTLKYWATDSCNMINGTEGSQFPRPITPERKLLMYSSDLCRSLYFTFEKKVMHGDLELYRYTLPFQALAKSPENDCYCSDEFTCKDSMINLSPCKDGAPIVASTPHFYMGPDEDIKAVNGLNPTKEEHATFLDIEPNTGVTFQAHKRIQISVPLLRYPSVPALSGVQEVVLPILWLNESAVVPVHRANALYSKLTVPVIVVRYVCWTLLVVGTLMLILAVVLSVRVCRADRQQDDEKEPKKPKTEPVNDYDRTEAYKHLFTKT